ncbi:MAG: bifunctional oligoribonuclease/PAP phosphatase NrnA [Chloroflexi bacterium]|nr:bifunctional oligoribonuclease/PAP phosphatase NrnA [Chloroflexota bacterium]
MNQTLTFDQAVNLFKEPHRIFIAAHIMPDGDCIGSALGLTWALRKIGKTVTVTCHDHVSESFAFLPGLKELSAQVPTDEELLVFVDGSSADRYGAAFDPKLFGARPVLAIDHHATNENFAPLNFVDATRGSCAEIIFRFVRALDIPLDATIAQCLLTGIITDTLGFRTSNTSPDTLRIASALIEAGATIGGVVEQVFNQYSLPSLRLRGKVFSAAQLDGNILWAEVSQKDLRDFGITNNGAGGMINALLGVDAAQIAALFTEKESGKIDVSMRARPGYDVSGVAARLGGGGHKQAAGALLDGPLTSARERVLAELRKVV